MKAFKIVAPHPNRLHFKISMKRCVIYFQSIETEWNWRQPSFFTPIDSIWSLRWSWSRTQRMKKTRKPKLWTHSQLFDLLFDSFVLSIFKFLARSRDCKNVNFEIEFLKLQNLYNFTTKNQNLSNHKKNTDQTKSKIQRQPLHCWDSHRQCWLRNSALL